MSTERRRGRSYYYRARKINGKTVKQYAGPAGSPGARRAEEEALRARAERAGRQEMARNVRRQWAEAEAAPRLLATLATLSFRAAMAALGFERHNQGEWRKTRRPR